MPMRQSQIYIFRLFSFFFSFCLLFSRLAVGAMEEFFFVWQPGRIQSGSMEERARLFFFAENITTVVDIHHVIFVGCDGDVFRGECHFAI